MFALSLVVFFVACISRTKLINCLRQKKRNMLKLAVLTIFHGFLRLVLLSSLEFFIASFIVFASTDASLPSRVWSIVLLALLGTLMVFSTTFFCLFKKDKVADGKYDQYFGGLTEDLWIKTNTGNPLMLYFFFLMRRAIFAAILVFWDKFAAQQS